MEILGPRTIRQVAPEGQARSTIGVSLVAPPGDAILVQYAQPPAGARSSEDIVQVDLAILDAGTGTLRAATSALPRIDYVRGARALARGNNPFPKLDDHRVQGTRP
jgi:hypothetical protein